jgi:hypothetical protein
VTMETVRAGAQFRQRALRSTRPGSQRRSVTALTTFAIPGRRRAGRRHTRAAIRACAKVFGTGLILGMTGDTWWDVPSSTRAVEPDRYQSFAYGPRQTRGEAVNFSVDSLRVGAQQLFRPRVIPLSGALDVDRERNGGRIIRKRRSCCVGSGQVVYRQPMG